MQQFLENLHHPRELKTLNERQLNVLATVIRDRIIEVTSKTGGHLASSLGVVELTLALLKFFDFEKDKIVWDVGHQGYAYKILTGRNSQFGTIGKKDGLAKFLNREESNFDHFGAGHASTSISAALGIAVGEHLQKQNNKIIAVIGDGALTGGLAFEALNHAGHLGQDLIVILNDNNMSIGPNISALSRTIINIQSSKSVNRLREEVLHWEKGGGITGAIGNTMKKLNESFMAFFTPGVWFEKLNFRYFGPVDGHNIHDLVSLFEHTKNLKGPLLLHVLTKKGKGYSFAEGDSISFHGVNAFEPTSGKLHKPTQKGVNYTSIWSKTFDKVISKDEDVVAISAAMIDNTGLAPIMEKYPERVFDVGIAEGHAVTSAAGMATTGVKPFVVIYSTFMQRAIDHVIHDVALQNLPVRFILDRGGFVGADGATHHGVLDLTFMSMIPNMVVMVPKDGSELQSMIKTAYLYNDGPITLRFPRGAASVYEEASLEEIEPLPIGKSELLRSGSDILLTATGTMVDIAMEAAELLEKDHKISCGVINNRFIKPLDETLLVEEASKVKAIVTLEENAVNGGMGSAVIDLLLTNNVLIPARKIGVPDRFIAHAKQKEQREECGLNLQSVMEEVTSLFKTIQKN